MEWKHINGWELIKAIESGEIKEGTKLKDSYKEYVVRCGHLTYNDKHFNAMTIDKSCVNCWDLINNHFELIEEQQDIDIQAIEEIEYPVHNLTRDLRDVKINKLIQAIKQLDRNIRKEK